MDKHKQRVQRLLGAAGTTYADEAGIRVDDRAALVRASLDDTVRRQLTD